MTQNKFFPFSMMTLPLLLVGILLFNACIKDDDDGNNNEEELITSVVLTFTPTNGGASSVFNFRDADGAGGADPVVDNIALAAATSYALSVKFLDESNAADVEDITLEVAEENVDHLICFETTGEMPQPAVEDMDDNGAPLGLQSRVITTVAGNGKLTIRLKHQPDKNAATPCNTGDSDVEASFNVTVL